METLFQSDLFCVRRLLCAATRFDHNLRTEHEVVFVRQGMFVIRTGDGETVVTPNHALLFPAGSEYDVSHPLGAGDECIVVAMQLDAFQAAFGRRQTPAVHIASSRLFLAQQELDSALRAPLPAIEAEERCLGLVDALAADFGPRGGDRQASPRERRAVRLAEELLSARFTESLPLSFLAQQCALSPAHLSRTFSRIVGMPLHRYQDGLRLRASLKRLAAGERSLSDLALDLGYFDHSHFTSAFRREFGVPPSAVRDAARSFTPG
jgi:AraC-like DNA-binding protein